VAQVIGGGCWKITVSEAVTLLEKFGLEAVAVSRPVALLPAVYAGTLTVKVTASLAPAAMIVARAQLRVLSVQLQPPAGSARAVMVSPGGGAKARTTVLSIGALALVLIVPTVTWSAVSPCLTINGLGLKVMESVGTTTGVTKDERSKSAYSSISSCALIVPGGGHSNGYALRESRSG